VPILPDAMVLAAGAHDQADGDTGALTFGCIRTMIDQPEAALAAVASMEASLAVDSTVEDFTGGRL
jgi:hypothetical protein